MNGKISKGKQENSHTSENENDNKMMMMTRKRFDLTRFRYGCVVQAFRLLVKANLIVSYVVFACFFPPSGWRGRRPSVVSVKEEV